MQLIADLKARGLIQDIMPGTDEQLQKEMTTGYAGFDPTADSLHVGNLLPITLLMRLQKAGHKPMALVGGATGMIGDPSGKSEERNLLDLATIDHNVNCQRKQLEKFLDFDASKPNAAELVNNYDWFKDFTFLEFIRTAGKHITVNYMMSKDSVQKRLETGLSFTEFTYQLIQGYDFFWLNKNKGVKLQLGGGDQWGNIVTGTELIRRMGTKTEGTEGERQAFAFTCPLITKADGTKFGKTETGTVWLDPAKTSPYQFYQFWLKLSDADAERMAYTFSFKDIAEIEALIAAHKGVEHQRQLQRALAEELTLLVHSADDLSYAQHASQILFSKDPMPQLAGLTEEQLLDVMDGVSINASKNVLNENFDLVGFLAEHGLYESKGAARKAIQGNGFSINKQKITSPDFKVTNDHLMNGRYLVLERGKGKYTLAIFS